jgi:hypothetical protein
VAALLIRPSFPRLPFLHSDVDIICPAAPILDGLANSLSADINVSMVLVQHDQARQRTPQLEQEHLSPQPQLEGPEHEQGVLLLTVCFVVLDVLEQDAQVQV